MPLNSPKFKRYLLDSIIVYLILCVIGGAHKSSDMADGGALRHGRSTSGLGHIRRVLGCMGEYYFYWLQGFLNNGTSE